MVRLNITIPPMDGPCLEYPWGDSWSATLSGIVELVIVFLLGVVAGYAWRDRISRTRRANYQERRRAQKRAVHYGADDSLAGCDKWEESPPVTTPAGPVALSGENNTHPDTNDAPRGLEPKN